MLQILSHTPVFVFVLFFVLLVLGFLQSRDRKVKTLVAFILPIFMVIFSATGVTTTFGINLVSIGLWLSGLLLASIVLYKIVPLKGAIYLASENKIFIPGSWLPFAVIMAIFFTKYAVGIMMGMQLPVVHEASFMMYISFIYGCFSGFFTSRAFALNIVKTAHQKNS
jgi:hypothetical protein